MKTKFLTLFVLTTVLLTAVVSATVYEPNYVYNGNTKEKLTDVSVIGFICDNAECTENRALWPGILSTGDNNIIVLAYPTYLMSDYGYQIYFFKEGYFPYKVNANWYGEGRTPNENNYLYKMNDEVSSKIEDFNVQSTIKKGETATIIAKILSPRTNEDNIKFIPDQLEADYYSDKVKVTLSINGNDVETKNINMLWSTEQNVEFSYTPTSAGGYTVKITTEITDNKFTNAKTETAEKILTVSDSEIPSTDTTNPIITINSPEAKEYHVSEIKFRITSNEALSDAWFILNLGTPVTMTRISSTQYEYTINLEDGNYELKVFAEDMSGNIGEKTVKFSVDTSHEDTTKKSDNNGYRTINSDDETTINHKKTINSDLYQPEQPEVIAKKTSSFSALNISLWVIAFLCIILLVLIIILSFNRL